MADVAPASVPAILLIAPDEALLYLMDRYAERGGFVLRTSSDGGIPAVVWVASVSALDAVRPREQGLVGEEVPLIVIAADEEDARARELGADHRVEQPFTFQEFLAALAAVGVTT